MKEPLAGLNSRKALRDLHDLPAAEDAASFLHDRPEVLLLEAQRLQIFLYFAQIRFLRRLERPLVGRLRDMDKVPPRNSPGILLAQVRQHLVNILAEHRIDRQQIDLLRPQILPLPVEQVSDPLQQHGGLPASRDPVYQEHRHVIAADDRVLLLLDRGGDRLHLVRAATGQ